MLLNAVVSLPHDEGEKLGMVPTYLRTLMTLTCVSER